MAKPADSPRPAESTPAEPTGSSEPGTSLEKKQSSKDTEGKGALRTKAGQARKELSNLAHKYGRKVPALLRREDARDADPLEKLIDLDSDPSFYSSSRPPRKKKSFLERLFGN